MAACSSSKPQTNSCPRATSDESSARWASAESSQRWTRSWSLARRHRTSNAVRLLRSVPGCALSSETSLSILSGRYNPDAVVCAGIPFGHTRPQWIVPHCVLLTVDGAGAAGLLPITHSRAGPPGVQRGLAGSPGRSRITASAAATTATAGAIRAICQPVMPPTTMDGADGEPPPMGRAGRANAAGTAMVEASSAAVRMARAPATRWMGGDGGWGS